MQRNRPRRERHADLVRSGIDARPHHEMFVDVIVVVVLQFLDGELLEQRTIEQQIHLVRPAQPLDVFVAVAGQAHANLILSITRKRVRQQHPATCAHRQSFDMFFLREICRQPKRESIRAGQRRAHRKAADLLRSGEVTIEQARRERIDGDVVKAVALLVLRQ